MRWKGVGPLSAEPLWLCWQRHNALAAFSSFQRTGSVQTMWQRILSLDRITLRSDRGFRVCQMGAEAHAGGAVCEGAWHTASNLVKNCKLMCQQ